MVGSSEWVGKWGELVDEVASAEVFALVPSGRGLGWLDPDGSLPALHDDWSLRAVVAAAPFPARTGNRTSQHQPSSQTPPTIARHGDRPVRCPPAVESLL